MRCIETRVEGLERERQQKKKKMNGENSPAKTVYIIHVTKQRIKNDKCSMGGGNGTAAGRAAPLLFFLSIEVAIVAEASVVTGMVVLLAPRQEPKHLV